MVAVVLCAAFSGLAGVGLSLALIGGGAWGPGLCALALGAAGMVGVVSAPLRGV